jgi:DNA end-binding protein Ku
MARSIWNGALSFGLINIPISIMSSKQEDPLRFRTLDKRDHALVGYRNYNKSTGEDVPKEAIVKGFEYEPNQFVVLTDEDFKKANPKATQTIDIQEFVSLEDLDPLLFEKPYYLVPGKNGEKGYLLLKEVLERQSKVAIATFVLRTKQHLAVVMPRGDYLILEIIKFANEIREVEEATFLDEVNFDKVKISEKEIKVAESLVEGMTEEWNPKKFENTYEKDLLHRIEEKVKKGEVEMAPEVDEEVALSNTNVVDLLPLLEKSLQAKGRRKAPAKKTSKSKNSSGKKKHA